MTVLRRVLGLIFGLLVTVGAIGFPVSAHADAPSPLAVRLDRHHWTSRLVVDPFAPARAWRPGDDTRFATIWVRNRAPKPADLDLELRRRTTDTIQGLLDVKVKIGSADWSDLALPLGSQVFTIPQVAGGTAVPVRLAATVNFGPSDIVVDPRDLTFDISVVKSSAFSGGGSGVGDSGSNLFLAPIFLGVALLLLTGARVKRRLDRGGVAEEPVADRSDALAEVHQLDPSDA